MTTSAAKILSPKNNAQVYIPSPIKKQRRSRADMDEIRQAINQVLESYRPMTVRQVFYQLVSKGAIGKSEAEYKQTVCRLLTEMRKDGSLPFSYIADNTRWQRKPTTWSSMDSALFRTLQGYRRALWDNQEVYVELWIEKDALASVLYDVTEEFDVPLMVARGYSSHTYLHSAGEAIQAQGKPAYIYYFGDHDPSGEDINRFVEKSLREYAPNTEIHFRRVAVTSTQIEEWKLPTRPTKTSDSRSKNFKGESTDVDAIPPPKLHEIARDVIEQHINYQALQKLKLIEREEKAGLANFIQSWKSEGGDVW